ncbi:hypothetical protein A9264_11675 [Vibrio sp. UCD-FRSSP16_10]|uniref:hypothetical protein n=1 Tax=unclassified Vibrio TaxID=2614977 RepID=UPI0007FBAD14|nr:MULTISPECIES: hypothetical protein [unclassified Vibrio]OBT16292.1 hypothetical protein A9260_11885 [Vibrio sp. UCD-FRSSP16_30]OBT21157.1 hypothetical protein A9264_11675 [Vibrio sp. UCD-FRSSP16_10]
MKKLPAPVVNDTVKITATSQNTRLDRTSYPYLSNQLQAILNGYQNYDANDGNALLVANVNITNNLSSALKKHYASPPSDLKFIDELRASSPNVCPMCGSLKTGTLDHLFPKDDYPWFAVYSKNLVPACDCNSKRGKNLKGVSKRILHPYYDLILNQRLLSCSIVQDPQFPNAKIKIDYVLPQHPEINSIKYHAEKVVIPSGIINWLEGEWDTTTQNPSSKIQTLPLANIPTVADFSRYLNDALNRYDQSYSTPNNWFSIFIHGILNSQGVVRFLYSKHNVMYP